MGAVVVGAAAEARAADRWARYGDAMPPVPAVAAPMTPSLASLVRPVRPGVALLEELARQGGGQPLSYAHAGATLDEVVPDGFTHTSHRAVIGSGPEAWDRAVRALHGWRMFHQPWIVMPDLPAPREGLVVAFASRQLGTWALHSCQVVATIEAPDRVGFAYGTLATHAVAGEERFLVERDPDGEVHFSLWKFARPAHPLVRLAGPIMTHQQSRFDVGATEAMRRAVEEGP